MKTNTVPTKKIRRRPLVKKKSFRDLLALLFIVVIVLVAIIVVKQQYDLSRIRSEKQQIQMQLDALKSEQIKLNKEKERLNDAQFIEQQAREQGMTKPGEIPYLTGDSNNANAKQ